MRRRLLALALVLLAPGVGGCAVLDELDGDADEQRSADARAQHEADEEENEQNTADVTVKARVPEAATAASAPGTAKGAPLCFAPPASRERLATDAWARLCGRAAARKHLKVVAVGTAGCARAELSATVRSREDYDYVKTIYLDIGSGAQLRKVRARIASPHGVIADETIIAACRAMFADYPSAVDGKLYVSATQLAAPTPQDYEPPPPPGPPPWLGPHESSRFVRIYYDRINVFFSLNPSAAAGRKSDERVTYGTKSDWLVGGAFGVGGISGAYATTRPRPSGDKGVFGRTHLSAYQADFTQGHWDASAFHRRFKGFYRNATLEEEEAGEGNFVQAPDLEARATGVTATYIADPQAVVLPGRTASGLFPVERGYSALLGFRLIDSRVANPDPLLPESERRPDVAEDQVRGFTRTSLGPNVGLAAHVPFGRGHVSADGSAAVGLEFQQSHYLGGGGTRRHVLVPLLTRLGGRYLLRSGEVGVAGVFDYDSVQRDDLTIGMSREIIETYLALWL